MARKMMLQVFLVMGIGSGLLEGAYFGVTSGLINGLKVGFITAVLFGGLSVAVWHVRHIRAVRRLGYGYNKETLGLYHIRKIELNAPLEQSFDLCVQSINTIKLCKITSEDRDKKVITAKARWHFIMWDTITFTLRKKDENVTEVEIESRPTVTMTIVDYGKSLDNVEKIASFLKKQLLDKSG